MGMFFVISIFSSCESFFYLASLINMLCQNQQALVEKKKIRTACYYHNIIVLDLIVNYCLVMQIAKAITKLHKYNVKPVF